MAKWAAEEWGVADFICGLATSAHELFAEVAHSELFAEFAYSKSRMVHQLIIAWAD